jgi:predicted transcriptional regulator
MAMSQQLLERLTRREREIVEALFALGNRGSAEDIRTRLLDPPSYSAVRTMLARLEEKGYVRRDADGRRHVYSATSSPARTKRAALQRYLGVFFQGSRAGLITALLRDEAWSDDELDALQSEIDRVRRHRRQR